MKIAECNSEHAGWNAFVEKAHGASIFHRLEWHRIIATAYDHHPYYLTAEEEGSIQGVLPLFLIRSRLFGRSLVSLPFADYGGICAENSAAVRPLLEAALRIGKAGRADYLQLRHREPLAEIAAPPNYKVTMLLRLNSNPRTLWDRLPSERRNRIKKAQRMGVSARFVAADGLEAFYRVFSENMRDIGSPVHSLRFFRAVVDALGPLANVLLVEHLGTVIGAAICLFFRKTLYIPWVSSLRSHFNLNPNMMLYWAAVEHGCLHGYEELDFGRSSKGSGTFEFKRQWGAVPLELAWSSFALNGKVIPTFSGQGFTERVLIECWKRLPMVISTQLGSRVRGLIPA